MLATLIWGTPSWVWPAGISLAVALLLVSWSYWRAPGKLWPRLLAGLLKLVAVAALLFCLLEPLFSGVRPRPGANLFLILADNSRGLRVHDANQRVTRGDQMKRVLRDESSWNARLSQDFEVRRYAFDRRLRPVASFGDLDFEGASTELHSSLSAAAQRFRGRPNAGVLLFTDGLATDEAAAIADWSELPPIYPVVVGSDQPLRDLRVARLSVTQTNFETAPITVTAEIDATGIGRETLLIQLLDRSGKELQRAELTSGGEGEQLVHRFQFQPTQAGVSFYQIRVCAAADEHRLSQPERTSEATLENNTRWVVVDRGGGPYRVLYVGGRPNWEFKFLRRAVQEDDEVSLVGLVRVAKKQPKFSFRSRGETTSPLYRGFGNDREDDVEQYDQPVLIRLGTEDAEELRDGFPQDAATLFRYHAVIVDDVEAAFFTQDQMSLIQQFVSQRGGGFMMLGGRETFAGGKYARTPIGELLPVYCDAPGQRPSEEYQLSLTREGWLQSWVRVRSTEEAEQQRLSEMPGFRTVNRIQSIKPGASVLSQVKGADGQEYPALVSQRFGKGRSAALLIGDLWLWGLRSTRPDNRDLEQTWRQTVRWLVSDIPGRVEVDTLVREHDPAAPVELLVRVRDEEFRPLDNATVRVDVSTPDGKQVSLPAEPSDQKAGTYLAVFTPRLAGPYRADVVAMAEDGNEIGRRQAGWVAEPATEEFRSLVPNRKLLAELAQRTGGEVVELDELDSFVASLPNRKIPITEPWIYPLWHRWSVFALAIGCLIGEWGLRRWNGLP